MSKNRIAIITGCSVKKLNSRAPAQDLYQGVLFKKVKNLTKLHKIDLLILSAKYGLLLPADVIEPYNMLIRNKKDIQRVREITLPKLKEIEQDYDMIILIMGKLYREVLTPLFKEKYKILYDQRGIGALTSRINSYLKSPLEKMLNDLIPCIN